jgi:hypothetical protein
MGIGKQHNSITKETGFWNRAGKFIGAAFGR